jgi:hypothetical protein
MVEKVISHLEGLGYSFVSYNAEESTEKRLRFKGEDSRGFYLEFMYHTEDGYLWDRAMGSKYWDIIEKTQLKD